MATSLLFSLFTFGLFVLLGHQLTAEVVFTSLALFNVLIAPLNSFPWVLNGTVEAVVSVRRLQGFLSSWETKSDWAYEPVAEQQGPGAVPGSAPVEAQRMALAEGLTLESGLPMSRADSSDLYTTINMERLPSGALPRYMSNAPSFASWSPMPRQQSTSAPAGQTPSAVDRARPPPDSGGPPRAGTTPQLSPTARSFSTSFKGWGQGHSAPALQHQGSSSSASATSASEAPPDQGIVTVLSDTNRLLSSTQSGDGHSIVLSGASFSWQPTLGRGRVVSSQAGRQNSHSRQGMSHQSRSGVLQPLLSEAAEEATAASSSNLVLKEINLTVRTGDLLVVTGEIGAGDLLALLIAAAV